MKIIFSTGILVLLFCSGFTFNSGTDYQVVTFAKVSLEQKSNSVKTGTFLYTQLKELKSAFPEMTETDVANFNFENYRYVHIQYAEQAGCKNQVEVIQEVRKYKHYYEIILMPYKNGACKTTVKPYTVTAIPNDRLPVLITGTLPE